MTKAKLKLLIFPLFLLLLVFVLAGLKVHGSSIGFWDNFFYTDEYQDPNLLLGKPRAIRSDEWLVQTPLILSQAEVGFKDHNDLFLPGQEFTLTDAPERNWAVFDPVNWAYFVLPLEQAFAFKWWFQSFLLAVSVYFLLLILTKNDILVSILAALSFLFSPYIQWWYSTFATEIASYGLLTFIFFIRIVDRLSHPLSRLFNALLFTYFSICFALSFYPPFQIPLAIFLALAGAGFVLLKRKELGDKRKLRILILTLLSCLIGIGLILGLFYLTNRTAIQAMTNTVFPGSRQETGAENGFLIKSMAGFYNIQLLIDSTKIPDFLINQSEASSYFFFSFFLLPFFLFFVIRSIIRRERIDLPLLFSLVGYVLLLLWETIGLPSFFAKVLLLNNVPAARTMFALGIINLLLIVHYVSRLGINKTLKYKIIACLYSVLACLLVFLTGKYLQAKWPAFLNNEHEIIAISVVVGAMTSLLLLQRKIEFFFLFFVFSLVTAFPVNPIFRGLTPLHNEKMLSVINPIKQKDPQAGWVVYDKFQLAPYLVANGVRVLNGVYLYPNINFWSRFDPQKKYLDIYNRYAHVFVTDSGDQSTVKFELVQRDVIKLYISPCNPLLEEVGVKYYLFVQPRPDLSCISLIKTVEFPTGNLFVYERIK